MQSHSQDWRRPKRNVGKTRKVVRERGGAGADLAGMVSLEAQHRVLWPDTALEGTPKRAGARPGGSSWAEERLKTSESGSEPAGHHFDTGPLCKSQVCIYAKPAAVGMGSR